MATGVLSVLSPWHTPSDCSRLKSSCGRLPDLALRHASRKSLESSEGKAMLYTDWYVLLHRERVKNAEAGGR